MSKKPNSSARRNQAIFAALFAALIAVSSFFVIPLPGLFIPVVLKNMFIILSGLLLGGGGGSAAVLIFLAAGIIGVPVFVIPGGIAAFASPIGGYLAGYLAGSLIAGLIAGQPRIEEKKITIRNTTRITIAALAGFATILLCGTLYLMRVHSLSLKEALAAGALPFIPGDTIKCIISIPLALKLRPITARYIRRGA